MPVNAAQLQPFPAGEGFRVWPSSHSQQSGMGIAAGTHRLEEVKKLTIKADRNHISRK